MKYYAWIRDGRFLGVSRCRLADGTNVALSRSVYEDARYTPDKYEWNGSALVVRQDWETEEQARQASEALSRAKAERARAVDALTVEVDGMIFDADEKAQERMSRAVNMADSLDEETEWVLADNTVAVVTAAQLRRACRTAGKAQTALWVKPYTKKETEE